MQSTTSPAPALSLVFRDDLRWRLARALASVLRVRELALGRRVFAGVGSDTWVRRRLFGAVMPLLPGRSDAQRQLYLQGERFVEESPLLLRLLRPGMSAVDVGANIGYYGLLIRSAVGPEGRVLCLEPSPENLPELRLAVSLNGFTNITVRTEAAGDARAVVGFKTGINGGLDDGGGGAVHRVTVAPLDELVEGTVDFIKIDVEGFEDSVLRGASRLLREHKPALFVEMHPSLLARRGVSCRSIHEFLSGIYSRIEAHRLADRDGEGGVARVIRRYLGSAPVSCGDHMAFASAADQSGFAHTYWLSCRA